MKTYFCPCCSLLSRAVGINLTLLSSHRARRIREISDRVFPIRESIFRLFQARCYAPFVNRRRFDVALEMPAQNTAGAYRGTQPAVSPVFWNVRALKSRRHQHRGKPVRKMSRSPPVRSVRRDQLIHWIPHWTCTALARLLRSAPCVVQYVKRPERARSRRESTGRFRCRARSPDAPTSILRDSRMRKRHR